MPVLGSPFVTSDQTYNLYLTTVMDGTIGLGATSTDKIGEVQLSDEIGEGC